MVLVAVIEKLWEVFNKTGFTLTIPDSQVYLDLQGSLIPLCSFQYSSTIQQPTSSSQLWANYHELTLNSSYCWEYSKMGLDSGFGITVICPEPCQRSPPQHGDDRALAGPFPHP